MCKVDFVVIFCELEVVCRLDGHFKASKRVAANQSIEMCSSGSPQLGAVLGKVVVPHRLR